MEEKIYDIILSDGKELNNTVCTSYSLHNVLQKFIDENLRILCITIRPQKKKEVKNETRTRKSKEWVRKGSQ